MATILNKPKTLIKAVQKRSFLSTALQMKQEANAAIRRGDVAQLKQQGYKFLTFDA